MVLTDRNRLAVSVVLGGAIYIVSILLILLFIEIADRDKSEFGDLVFVDLARDTQIVDLTRKQSEAKDKKKNNDADRNRDKNASGQQSAGASALHRTSDRGTDNPGASAGSKPAASGGALPETPGTDTTRSSSTSFSSRGTPNTFSSNTTNESDASLPDFPDSDSNDDFFNDETVSSFQGTADPSRNTSSQTETSGSAVVKARDTASRSFSSSSGSGSTATEGLGTASESGSAFSSGRSGSTANSSVVENNSSGSSEGATVSESTGTRSRNLSGTESRNGNAGNTSSGSDKANAELYGIKVEGEASLRKIVSGPNKSDLENDLKLYLKYLPPLRLIRISFTVTPQGSITDLKLVTALGYSKVEAAVLNWMRGFRFSPISSNDFISGVISIKLDLE